MRIAIPVWENRVSPAFDFASSLLIVELAESEEKNRFDIHLGEKDILHKCIQINEAGVSLLICGAISKPFLNQLAVFEIDVVTEISGNIGDVINAYLKKDLSNKKFLMPGCKKKSFGKNNYCNMYVKH